MFKNTTTLPCGHVVTLSEDGGEGMCPCIELLERAREDGNACADAEWEQDD